MLPVLCCTIPSMGSVVGMVQQSTGNIWLAIQIETHTGSFGERINTIDLYELSPSGQTLGFTALSTGQHSIYSSAFGCSGSDKLVLAGALDTYTSPTDATATPCCIVLESDGSNPSAIIFGGNDLQLEGQKFTQAIGTADGGLAHQHSKLLRASWCPCRQCR